MARHLALGWFALVVSLAASAGAAETSPQASPEKYMKARQTELFSLVKNKDASGDANRKVESVFDSMLDYDLLAQQSLRDQWALRTEGERKEFQETLKRLVQRAYRKNLDRTVSYEVQYNGESRQAETFVVRTSAKSRTNAREEPIAIDYVVHRDGNAWRIQDIVTEGSSLVGNYHQQFKRIIKKEGFAELLRRMKTRLESGET